jgi:hypothetical protein
MIPRLLSPAIAEEKNKIAKLLYFEAGHRGNTCQFLFIELKDN